VEWRIGSVGVSHRGCVDGLSCPEGAVRKGRSAEAGVSWRVQRCAPAQAGDRAGKSVRCAQRGDRDLEQSGRDGWVRASQLLSTFCLFATLIAPRRFSCLKKKLQAFDARLSVEEQREWKLDRSATAPQSSLSAGQGSQAAPTALNFYEFQKKWQLNVYFSIREKELTYHFTEQVVDCKRFFEVGNGDGSGGAKKVRVGLAAKAGASDALLTQVAEAGAVARLPATEGLFAQLARIWRRQAPIVYLDGLYARFLGLTVKFLHMWVRDVVKHYSLHAAAVSAPAGNAMVSRTLWANLEPANAAVSSSGAAAPAANGGMGAGSGVGNGVSAGLPSGSPRPNSTVATGSPHALLFIADLLYVSQELRTGSLALLVRKEVPELEAPAADAAGVSATPSQQPGFSPRSTQQRHLLQLVGSVFEDTHAEIQALLEKFSSAVLQRVHDRIAADIAEGIKKVPPLYSSSFGVLIRII